MTASDDNWTIDLIHKTNMKLDPETATIKLPKEPFINELKLQH